MMKPGTDDGVTRARQDPARLRSAPRHKPQVLRPEPLHKTASGPEASNPRG